MQIWQNEQLFRLKVLEIAHNIGKTMALKWVNRSCTLDMEVFALNVENVIVKVEYLVFTVVVFGVYQFVSDFDHVVVKVDVAVDDFEKSWFKSSD